MINDMIATDKKDINSPGIMLSDGEQRVSLNEKCKI